MTTLNKYLSGILIVLALLVIALVGKQSMEREVVEPELEVVEVNEPEETPEPQITAAFDTSIIEGWCAGDDYGTVRMLGAWYYEEDCGTTTVEDEAGNLWGIEEVPIREDDFLLLWIADNNTPDNVNDDIVLKVWTELHY